MISESKESAARRGLTGLEHGKHLNESSHYDLQLFQLPSLQPGIVLSFWKVLFCQDWKWVVKELTTTS